MGSIREAKENPVEETIAEVSSVCMPEIISNTLGEAISEPFFFLKNFIT